MASLDSDRVAAETKHLVSAETAATREPFALIPELEESIPAPAGHAARPRRHPGLMLAVLATAMFLSALDLFVVNVALNPIGKGLHETSLSNLSWILNGYAIVYAALLVPSGRFADRYGRKGTFVLGLSLFTLASLGAALSGGLWLLVAFRLLQAAGAAALTPASLGLVLSIAPEGKIGKYVQIWTVSGAVAAAAGPVVGGLLVQASWRWIFLLNLPIGVAAVLAAAALLPNLRHDASARIPDLLGAALLIVGIAALALALVQGPTWGWASASIIAAFAVAVVALAGFLLRTARAAAPIVDLHLFENRVFTAGTLVAFFSYAGLGTQLLGLILWLQQDLHYSTIGTGLAIAGAPLLVVPGSTLGQVLTRWVSGGLLGLIGAVLTLASTLTVAFTTGHAEFHYATQVLPMWFVGGLGFGLTLPGAMAASTSELAPHQAATGSAVVTMAGQLGSVVGVSLLVVLLAIPGVGSTHAHFVLVWILSAALTFASGIAALGTIRRTSPA